MKTIVILLIALYISGFCDSRSRNSNQNTQQSDAKQIIMHTDSYHFTTVFLNIEYTGKVAVYNSPYSNKTITYVQNNDEDIVMFDLLHKQDSMYYVVAYNGGTGQVLAIGWISKENHLNISLKAAAYGRYLTIYENANDRKTILFSDKEGQFTNIEIIDFENDWLKIKFNYNNGNYIGWLPPEMQCGNPYTTCN